MRTLKRNPIQLYSTTGGTIDSPNRRKHDHSETFRAECRLGKQADGFSTLACTLCGLRRSSIRMHHLQVGSGSVPDASVLDDFVSGEVSMFASLACKECSSYARTLKTPSSSLFRISCHNSIDG